MPNGYSFSIESDFRSPSAAVPNLPPLQAISGRVRLVKDVLRVGRWFVGDGYGNGPDGEAGYWNCTLADLEAIAARFAEHKAAGLFHPLCWDHSKDGADTSEKDSIADIAEVWVGCETLWCSVYVDPATKTELTKKRRQVSISTVVDWRDGTGKVWPGQSLIHVAVVAHAVVPDQRPFVEMSLPKPSKVQPMTPAKKPTRPASKPPVRTAPKKPAKRKGSSVVTMLQGQLNQLSATIDKLGSPAAPKAPAISQADRQQARKLRGLPTSGRSLKMGLNDVLGSSVGLDEFHTAMVEAINGVCRLIDPKFQPLEAASLNMNPLSATSLPGMINSFAIGLESWLTGETPGSDESEDDPSNPFLRLLEEPRASWNPLPDPNHGNPNLSLSLKSSLANAIRGRRKQAGSMGQFSAADRAEARRLLGRK